MYSFFKPVGGKGHYGRVTDLRLRAPINHVSPRARWYWATRALIGWVIVFVTETVVWLATLKPEVQADRAVLAAWTAVARGLLNLDETITKE